MQESEKGLSLFPITIEIIYIILVNNMVTTLWYKKISDITLSTTSSVMLNL